jgi:hypothetical protein
MDQKLVSIMLIPRRATPRVSGDPGPGRPRDIPHRRVSLVVLAVVVGALTACQGPTPAAGNPLSSLGIGGSSPAEYCRVVRQSNQEGVARMNRLFGGSDPSHRFGNMSQADISQAVDEAVAANKLMTEAAPPEIRHDYEVTSQVLEKFIKAMKRQIELSSALVSNDPAARNAAIAALSSPDVTAVVNDILVEMQKPEVVEALQHIIDYKRTHCGIDMPGPKDIDHLFKNLPLPGVGGR